MSLNSATAGQPARRVTVECAVDVLVEDETDLLRGAGSVEIGFDLPGSMPELLHFLRCDEWVIDDAGLDWQVDTVLPDDVSEWEDDGLTVVGELTTGVGSGQRLRQLHGGAIETVTITEGRRRVELVPSVDAIVEWIEREYGPLRPPEAARAWVSPPSRRKDLFVDRADPDPSVVTNAAWRAQIRATGLPWRIKHGPSGMEMVLVPPARTYAGPPNRDWKPSDGPRGRMADVPSPFYIAVAPFTFFNWHNLYGKPLRTDIPRHTIVNGLTGSAVSTVLEHLRMALPSELEWEHACRAGTLSDCYGAIDDIAWSAERLRSSPRTGKGGALAAFQLAANGFGLFDMLGAVWEPCGSASGGMVLRGGSGAVSSDECSAMSVRPMPEPGAPLHVGLRPVIHVKEASSDWAGFPP